MCHFPLRSTRSEHFFAFFLHLYNHFSFGGKFSGRVVSRSGKHGRQPVVLFVCLLVHQEDTSVVIYTQSLYYLFDITVHLSSVPFKTTLCQMFGLHDLVAFAKIHFTGYRFQDMPTTLKLAGKSLFIARNTLANALRPANLCE